MAKIIRLFGFLFSIILLLNAADERLANFDALFDNANQKVMQQLHHDMKSLYVKAIINSDEISKKEALKRLIKSSKALGLNSKAYEEELGVGGNENNSKPIITAKISQKQTEDIVLKINSVVKNKDNLELKLNKNIDKNDIKFSKLNSNGVYRYIYDIKGVYTSVSSTIQGFLSDEIRITQFNKDSVRIVFSSKNQHKIEFFTGENRLYFITSNQGLGSTLGHFKNETQNDKKNEVSIQENTKQDLPKSQPKNIKKVNKNSKIIVLDAGHGGKDAGAIGENKIYEKNVVLAIALKTGEELTTRGYKVFYTRSKDKFINLRDRTSMANDKLADLFISIHANAAPNTTKAKTMHGIETFFLSPARSERSKNAAALENKTDIEEMNYFSQQTFLNFLNREKIIASNKLAIDVQREVLASARKINSNVSDGGVREAPFWVLVGALMPAVLLEVGYITHPNEGKLINQSSYQNAIAKGLADGVDIYFTNQQ
jgi:N-acetylmuramoyl-L-alanine amidase domain protein